MQPTDANVSSCSSATDPHASEGAPAPSRIMVIQVAVPVGGQEPQRGGIGARVVQAIDDGMFRAWE